VGLRCNKLQQVKRDIFGAARCVNRFHECSLSFLLA
jgi:hypothetical protein